LHIPAGEVAFTDNSEALAVIGWFQASEPIGFLNSTSLVAADPADPLAQVRTIHVLASSPDQVGAVADAALSVLDPDDPTSVGVQTSEALAQVRAAVRGELGRYGRQLVTMVLAAGLVLVALTLYGAVTGRRRDFGRRRALGASRSAIVTLVCLQTLVVALLGALAGTLIGAALIWRWTNTISDPSFAGAVATLAVIAATLAAIPPALVAAYRDPVRILRVP
jgi:putative ABC transport system permease protein